MMYYVRVGFDIIRLTGERKGSRQHPMIRLTNPKTHHDTSPVFLDSNTVLFLSDRSGSTQLWTISISGGEASQLSDFPLSVSNLKVNRKRNLIAFTALVYPVLKEFIGDEMKETKRLDDEAKTSAQGYTCYSNLPVRTWDHWTGDKRNHVFVQAIAKTRGIGWKLASKPVDIMFGRGIDHIYIYIYIYNVYRSIYRTPFLSPSYVYIRIYIYI